MRTVSEFTRIIDQVREGDPRASEQLIRVVYQELHALAAAKLAKERPGQTLQATALVHEAYLRLVGAEGGEQWNGRNHFFGAAAEAMRRILVENFRRKNRIKHGGELQRAELDPDAIASPEPAVDLSALDEALSRLAQTEPA